MYLFYINKKKLKFQKNKTKENVLRTELLLLP